MLSRLVDYLRLAVRVRPLVSVPVSGDRHSVSYSASRVPHGARAGHTPRWPVAVSRSVASYPQSLLARISKVDILWRKASRSLPLLHQQICLLCSAGLARAGFASLDSSHRQRAREILGA
jgi:hypothetical protein